MWTGHSETFRSDSRIPKPHPIILHALLGMHATIFLTVEVVPQKQDKIIDTLEKFPAIIAICSIELLHMHAQALTVRWASIIPCHDKVDVAGTGMAKVEEL